MSSPKALIQVLITGTRIFGKAFAEAGRQAVKNAKQSPQAVGSDVAGVGNATSTSATDQITREHRMTLDEAHLILNLKRDADIEAITKNYDHLFKANSPPSAPSSPPSGKPSLPVYSHYLQSKVFRARERIMAERNQGEPPPSPDAAAPSQSASAPPPSS